MRNFKKKYCSFKSFLSALSHISLYKCANDNSEYHNLQTYPLLNISIYVQGYQSKANVKRIDLNLWTFIDCCLGPIPTNLCKLFASFFFFGAQCDFYGDRMQLCPGQTRSRTGQKASMPTERNERKAMRKQRQTYM